MATCQRNIYIATLLSATCCVRLATVLRHVGWCWLRFDHFQIWANNTQHAATYRNTVAKRTQHVAPNNVATCCVGMLRSFGRGLRAHAYHVRIEELYWHREPGTGQNNETEAVRFWFADQMDKSEHLLCFVPGQGQNTEQQHNKEL